MPSKNSRPNQPIRPPTPLDTSPAHISHQPPPWTRSQLEREREAFFDTRVSGNQEAWKGLRVVSELLRKEDFAEAQGILDALNLTCPNGRIASGRGRDRVKGGVYDERGELYELPTWVLTDPQDVIEDEEKDATDGAADDKDEGANAEAVAAAKRRDEKGKGRAEDPGEMIQLRARLSDRGTDVTVSVGMKQKIGTIVKSIQEQAGAKRIRLMYLGKAMDERKTLEECGFKQGNVVNAMVFAGDESMLESRKSSKSK